MKRYITLCFLSVLLMPIIPMQMALATSTTVSVNPSESYVAVGKTLNVSVNVANVANLTSWQFTLYFLNSLLNCTNIVEGPFLKTAGGTFFNKTITNNYNSTHGSLLANSTLIGHTSANGSGVLATISFNALAAGDTPLHLNNTRLGDEKIPPQPIDHTAIDGTAHVQNFHLSIVALGNGTVVLNNSGPFYYYGEVVLLTAVPDIGWSFKSWFRDLSGSANPATLTIDGNKSVNAIFTQIPYYLNVTVVGSGSVSKNPDNATYTWGTNVSLTAVAGVGWSFGGWGGDASGMANPITINMTGNKTVTATFTQDHYTLTVTPVGSGSVSKSPDNATYVWGTNVSLTATPAIGWSFGGWGGDASGTSNPTVVNMTGNKAVTATFTRDQYTLIVTSVGSGSVTRNSTGPYYYGDAVLLTATASTGWTFYCWTGDLSSFSNPASLIMTSNKSVTAVFNQDQYTLTVSFNGSGFVNKNPNRATYTYGTVVSLTAIASVGWTFGGWSGDASGTANPVIINMTGNKTVTATFTQDVYTLTTSVEGSGSVGRNNSGPYHYGDMVQLTASASVGWSFGGWSGDASGTGNPVTVNMTGNKAVAATFTRDQYILAVNIVGSGSISKSPDNATYVWGTNVSLTATPAIGWSFGGWGGDASGMANPITINMTGNKVVAAMFTQDIYSLTISLVGSGLVNLNGSGPYHYGDVVLLSAVPTVGWSFDHWSGALSGSSNPTPLVMTGNKSVTATFTQDQYTLSVSVNGSGFVSKSPNNATYTWGTNVSLTATPAIGWSFGGWGGDASGMANPITINMTGNKTVTATFTQDQYTLAVTVIGSGSVGKSPDNAAYTWGTNVSLTAVAGVGWSFANWSGDVSGTANPITINMTSNKTVTATFTQNQYTLTVSVVGSGSVGKSSNQTTYTWGTNVTLTATPATGWSFAGWSGDVVGMANPVTINMTSNKVVNATFAQDQYTLTVNIVGNGSVGKSPNQTTYVWGTNVSLTASAGVGWSFANWSGDVSGSVNPVAVNMTGNKVVTAAFIQNQYTLTVTVVGSGSVNRNNTGPYYYGDVVQLAATASVGWTFDHWSGDLTGSADPATIVIDSNKSVTAIFIQNTYTLAVNTVGSGSVGRNSTGPYHYGDVVQLTAVAATGWSFQSWSGGLSGSTNPATLTITGNMTVTATFTQDQYTLPVNVVGSGSVSKSPNQTTYVWGTNVSLSATPAIGWSFGGWSGDASGTVNPVTVNMTGNKVVTATFTQNTYTLTVNTVGNGSVSKNNAGPYYYGDAVQLTANAQLGWVFSIWSGDLVGSANPATLTVDGDKVVTATFTQGPVGTHDVAVTNVTTSKQGCPPYPTVFQNYTCRVFVTVENLGNFTETFRVTAYVNSTLGIFPVAETNVTLPSNSSTIITFTWDTTGLAKGNYTIYARAETVPNETEIDNNMFDGGLIGVTMIGDIRGITGGPDGKVDIRDVSAVAKLFGVNFPSQLYNPNCDVNDDGKIDIRDVSLVAKHFGDTDP